jgi:hypothetical protein
MALAAGHAFPFARISGAKGYQAMLGRSSEPA